MRAVDVGVGHDDDALVAEIVELDSARPMPQPSACSEVGEFLVAAHLVGAGGGDVQDLAAQRQDGLGLPVARLLGRAAGAESPSTRNISVPSAPDRATIGELAGQAQLARRALARDLLLLPPACSRSSACWIDEFQQPVGFAAGWRPASDRNGSRTACSTSRAASVETSVSLVWPWNSGSRMNTETSAARRRPSRRPAVMTEALLLS